jgi:pyruvate/2-oxoglutarate dehydrogenase complex dihydrolipoamide dehydrogenase (E3) component
MVSRGGRLVDKTYDLVVVGAGSAGLTAAGFARGLGARVVLVERDRTGGDCTWTGCVPSKTLLKTAKVAHYMRSADRYGLMPVEPEVDLQTVMAHVRNVIAETYREETPQALRAKGIHVILGQGRFVDPYRLVVGDTTLRARNVVLATGAHPLTPPIQGLEAVDYRTYETIWDLEALPQHLLVVGGGPIGSEMSQAFRRLGARVTLIQSAGRILPRDEPQASHVMSQVFASEGIDLRYNTKAEEVWQDEDGIHLLAGGEEVVGDALLVAVGRRPNVAGLDLEKAGVVYDAQGIRVDDKLRTSQPHIYAAGDCIGGYQFTHYAGWQAAIAVRNALLPLASTGVRETVPWTTFTDPEVARAGLTEEQARERFGDAVEILEWPMTKVDRPRAEVDTEGFVKLVHRGGKVLGVTILSQRAGELIQEWIYALEYGVKLRDVATAVHVYPTFSRANAKAGGELVRRQLLEGRLGGIAQGLSQLMLRLMRWRRGF